MSNFAKRIKTLKTLAVFTLASVTPYVAQANENQNELEVIKQDFIAVKKELDAIKDQALETPAVQQAYANEEKALKSELLDEAPDKSEEINAYFQARSDFAAAYGSKSQSELKTIQTEIEKLAADIKDDLESVKASEEVTEAQQAVRDAIISTMVKIDPRTSELIEEQNQLYERYQELAAQG